MQVTGIFDNSNRLLSFCPNNHSREPLSNMLQVFRRGKHLLFLHIHSGQARISFGHQKSDLYFLTGDWEEDDGESSEQEFQKATEAMCIDGGASLHSSHRQLKQWAREVNVAEPAMGA